MIGAALAHYRITGKLGAGGMGEVWRAEDEKLGRKVALKVLPEEFAQDPERMARFEREARVLASLNHPNIAHLCGLETIERTSSCHSERAERVEDSAEERWDSPGSGTGSGTDADAGTGADDNSKFIIQNSKLTAPAVTFLVMELVEGEDLSARIARGRIPSDEAIPIALQIAAALEAAHEAGIVHRDLKPANIKLKADGTVKVLDFGLAKAWESDVGSSSLSLSPTMTQHATIEGVILGTAAYMSPEQAKGKKVDRRADIWAFGVVLWEMLTGAKLFDEETASETLAAVLKDEPDWESLPVETPRRLVQLLRRCLQRDPRRRLHDIADGRLELEDSLSLGFDAVEEGVAPSGGSMRWRVAGGVTAGLAAGLLISILVWSVRGQSPAPVPVLSFRPVTQLSGLEVQPSLSPDGRFVAYASDTDGDWDIYLLRTSAGNPINLTAGSEEADIQPAFSPDGEEIAFRSERNGGGIFIMGATGESVVRVTDYGYNPAWTPDGAWIAVATTGGQEDVWVISRDGPEVRRLTDDPARDRGVQWSPDGTRIAFYSDRSGKYELWAIRPDGSGLQQLTATDVWVDFAVWSPDGVRMTTQLGNQRTVIFDLGAELPKPPAEELPPIGDGTVLSPAAWSPDGRYLLGLAAKPDGGAADHAVAWDFQDRSYRRMLASVSGADASLQLGKWLHSTQKIVSSRDGVLYLADAASGEESLLLDPGPGEVLSHPEPREDGGEIFFLQEERQADVWLATVSGGGPS